MSTMSFTRSGGHWLIAVSVAAALWLLCLAAMSFAATPAQADGQILLVPDQYPTIQAAINAAADGDEIRVAGGSYFERLVVTKSLQLTGGWDISFTEQLADTPTTVDAAKGGRGLMVYAAGIMPSVVISNFRFIHGDASGLGGVITPTVPNAPAPAAGRQRSELAPQQPLSQAPSPGELQAALSRLADQGAFPGGPAALAAARARAAGLEASSIVASPAERSRALTAAGAEIDCGGGIYVRAAQVRLHQVRLVNNTASSTGSGAGGGLCAVDLPGAGLQLEGVLMTGNVASTAGGGYGGGLFVSAGQPVTGALSLGDVSFRTNQAALAGNGYGGGVFLSSAPGTRFNLAVFSENIATANGRTGLGGGLYLDESAGVTLETVAFQLNTASTSLTVPDPTVDWNTGIGGAIYVRNSPALLLTSPGDDAEARSLLIGNVGALKGLGRGGGIYIESSPALRVERTAFFGNYAALYPSGQGETVAGGAIHVVGSPRAQLVDNDFHQNIAGVFGLEDFKLLGGAVEIDVADQVLVHGNRFVENAGGTAANPGDPKGGALTITSSDAITVSENVFTGNVANLAPSGGLGGALHAQACNDLLIHHNTFTHNRAGTSVGIGGALVLEVESAGESDFPAPQGIGDTLNNRVTISANTFRDNAAALDLTGDQALLGGALALNRTNGLLLANNLFANNQARSGAALALLGWDTAKYPPAVVGTARIVNNTLAANGGENGIYMEMWLTPITLTNNIIVSHTLGIFANTNQALGGMTAAVDYTVYNANGANSAAADGSTLVQSNAITAPVNFANFWGGDYRLQVTSAARDAGDPAGVPPAPGVDIEGTVRPFGPAVDIGAYEWHGARLLLPFIIRQTCPGYAGWAVGTAHGGYGMIIHTTDGGCTWVRQGDAAMLGAGDLVGVAAVDAQTAWVVGDNGVILHTTDGGAHWTRQSLPADVPPTALKGGNIVAVDRSALWAIVFHGGSGYILKTDDGGQRWVRQATLELAPGHLSAIGAADGQHAWAVGGRTDGRLASLQAPNAGSGAIFHTADGGNKWSLQKEVTHTLIDVRPVSPAIAWAAGKADTAVRTTDGGVNWQRVDTGTGLTDLNRIFTVDGNDVWMSGDHSVLIHTTNGLAPADQVRWTYSVLPIDGLFLMGITFADSLTGWVTNVTVDVRAEDDEQIGYLFRTDDGGSTWYSQTVPENSGFWNLVMVKNTP